jgi:ribose transport system substrate-binding protein
MLYRTPTAVVIGLLAAGLATAAPPKVVSLPNSDAQCFAPWASDTKLFQYPAKKGPYRIALANGYIANTWRIQMIKTAKAYAAQPEVAAKLKEFKVVSTGEDVAAQIAAINNFIDSGYDAIVVNAQNPAAFKPVIKRANDAGVVLVAFDNILDTEEAINVNVDQKGLGKYWAEWLVKNVPNGGKVLEVRGVSGTSVDRDRHEGIQEVFKASGKKWDTVEVIGKWDDPTAQKVIEIPAAPSSQRRFWLLVRRPEPEVCVKPPGFDEDLVVETSSEWLAKWHMGRISLGQAMQARVMSVRGPAHLVRALATLGLSRFADVEPA